jgi:hypothetical protein
MTLQDIKMLKDATEKLTKWESTGQAFGHFENIKSKKSDRMYEFYCLMRILADLRNNYVITLVPGLKGKKIFPQAPANKAGWARFTIEPKNTNLTKFQVCFGTKIKLSSSPQSTVAPDISIQNLNATDDPDETMVVLIMDPKYKSNRNTTIDVSLIREFRAIIDDLDIINANISDLLFHSLLNLKSNCLLTNGKAHEDQEQYCINHGMKQVGSFIHDTVTFEVIG